MATLVVRKYSVGPLNSLKMWESQAPPPTGEIVTRQCVQGRLTCSVGGKSHRGNSQGPVAWVAFVEETKRMKPTDKAILGMVSESPGRNASKPISGPETQ